MSNAYTARPCYERYPGGGSRGVWVGTLANVPFSLVVGTLGNQGGQCAYFRLSVFGETHSRRGLAGLPFARRTAMQLLRERVAREHGDKLPERRP
jgi:hypothetical protein